MLQFCNSLSLKRNFVIFGCCCYCVKMVRLVNNKQDMVLHSHPKPVFTFRMDNIAVGHVGNQIRRPRKKTVQWLTQRVSGMIGRLFFLAFVLFVHVSLSSLCCVFFSGSFVFLSITLCLFLSVSLSVSLSLCLSVTYLVICDRPCGVIKISPTTIVEFETSEDLKGFVLVGNGAVS